MKKIAFLTDAHLAQQIFLINNGSDPARINYRDEADEHKENLKTVLQDIVDKGISEVVFGGDIGSKESNSYFFAIMNDYGIKPRIILGNHDTYAEVSKYYSPDFITDRKELRYVQEDDYFTYIYLDTSSNSISDGQFAWFKDQLQTSKKIVIFLHHPVLEIITPIDHLGAALGRRDEIRQALAEIENEVIIFCGHYHMDDESSEKNILQISTPACSYQIEKAVETVKINDQTFGYRIITIENEEVRTELITFRKTI